MTKDAYRTYCVEKPDMPLFMRDWWMDAVCIGKEWEVIAGMPCLVRKRLGMQFVLMPQETQIGGYFGENVTAEEIAEALKRRKLAYYYQHFPLGSPLPKQLEKLGFTIREHKTYRIENLLDISVIEKRFSKNKQRQIAKAAGLETVMLTAEEFYPFHAACLAEQGKEIAYSETFLKTLDAACKAHNARSIIGIQDKEGQLYAAVYLVYDQNTCYYLIPCYSKRYGDSGAGARLVLESIRFASEHSKTFDFEGSMIPGVANHYAQFGSEAAIFYEVEKVYNPLALIALRIYKHLTRRKR